MKLVSHASFSPLHINSMSKCSCLSLTDTCVFLCKCSVCVMSLSVCSTFCCAAYCSEHNSREPQVSHTCYSHYKRLPKNNFWYIPARLHPHFTKLTSDFSHGWLECLTSTSTWFKVSLPSCFYLF